MGNFQWGKSSLNRMKGVNPQLIECANRSLAESRYDMTIPWMGGVREPEEQHTIFKEGNSKCDGYRVLSYHQKEASNNGYSNALDVIPVDGGYDNTRAMNHFARIMLVNWQEMIAEGTAEGVMIWGGTFGESGWDKPHYEIR